MPAPEINDLYQPAVLWAAVDYDRYGMVTVLDAPQDIRVRADNSETPDSEEASVTFDRPVWQGSIVKLGRVKDLPPGTDLSDEDESLMEVVTISSTPDAQARSWRHEGKLRFYRGTLPNFAQKRGNG